MSTLSSAASIAFLRAVHPGRPWHVVALPPDRGRPVARTSGPGGEDEIEAWIDKRQGEMNLYWHVNELRPGLANRKAKKEDVVAACFLHVDVDDVTALDRVAGFNPPATAVVFS